MKIKLKGRIICLGLCLSLCLASFTACRKNETLLKKITVSEVTHSVFYAPQYIAMELGFFKDEGLEIELVNGQGADKVMTSVIAGQAEIGLAGPEASIYVYNEGRENHSVIFSQLTKRDGSFLVSRNKEDNFTFESLKGKYIIGGRAGGVPEMTVEYVLKKHGLTPNVDVTVDTSVQFALMAGAFTGGTGDYVALFEPTASMVVAEGKGHIVASIGEESGEIPYTAYFASKDYISKNGDVIQSFTNAITKAQKWVANHSAREIAEKLMPYFPDTDLELLTTVTQRHKDIDAWNSNSVMKEESFMKLQEVMSMAGYLDKNADFNEVVDNSFALKADK